MKLSVQPLLKSNLSTDIHLAPQPLPFPTNSNGLAWWSHQHNVFSDVAGTVPATIGQNVGCWRSVDGWGNRTATQTDSNSRPTRVENGIQPIPVTPGTPGVGGNTGKFLNLTQTLSLVGDFTIYSVHTAATMPVEPWATVSVLGGQLAYPHWYYQPGKNFLNFGSGWYPLARLNGYANHHSEYGWNITTNDILCRVRRHYTGGQWRIYLQQTQTPERYTASNDGWTYPLNYLLHSGTGPTQAPPTGFFLKQLVVVVGEDCVVSGADTAIRAKLKQLEGIDL